MAVQSQTSKPERANFGVLNWGIDDQPHACSLWDNEITALAPFPVDFIGAIE